MKMSADISSQRVWFGLFSGDPMASDLPVLHIAAFRYSTAAGDVNWQAVTGGGAAAVTDTGIAVVADTIYVLKMQVNITTVFFYINDVLVATRTTSLPTSTTPLRWILAIRNLVAVSRSIRNSKVTMIQ
jgi:hypothetical protein